MLQWNTSTAETGRRWLPLWLYRGKSASIRRHCGLLQIAQATVELLHHPQLTKLDSLLAEEKGLLQSLDDDDEQLSCIGQLIKTLGQQSKLTASERYVSSVNCIVFLLYCAGYSMELFGQCCYLAMLLLIMWMNEWTNEWMNGKIYMAHLKTYKCILNLPRLAKN